MREETKAARDEEENKQKVGDNAREGAYKLDMSDEHANSLAMLLPEASRS